MVKALIFRAISFHPLFVFAVFFFLICTGDAVLSYLSPVYIESFVQNPFAMGSIISFSSLVGLACDLLIPKLFPHRPYSFYIWLAITFGILFPLSLILLPPWVPFFLLSMGIWGVYYEFIHFSSFHFIGAFIRRHQYATSWGIISAARAAAYLIGPLIAISLIGNDFLSAFSGSLIFYFAALLCFYLFVRFHPPSSHHTYPSQNRRLSSILTTWSLLSRPLWPLYLFLVVISIVDAGFWTIGTLISEQLRSTNFIGSFFLPAYSLPALIVVPLVGKFSILSGKKRAAFITALISGVFLLPFGQINSAWMLVAIVFAFSFFYNISVPEISACFEDYVTRLGKRGDELVGLQSSAISLSYIIGPILVGFIASKFGHQATFSLLGLLTIIVSLLCLVIVPRKIRLPQAQISYIY